MKLDREILIVLACLAGLIFLLSLLPGKAQDIGGDGGLLPLPPEDGILIDPGIPPVPISALVEASSMIDTSADQDTWLRGIRAWLADDGANSSLYYNSTITENKTGIEIA